MAVPAGTAAYSYKKSGDTPEDLERIMAERGIKSRGRDRLARFLIGITENFAIPPVTLGQSEALCLKGVFGFHGELASLNEESRRLKRSQCVVNTPVEAAQQLVDYHNEDFGPRPY